MECKCGGSTVPRQSTENKVVVLLWDECRVCGRVANKRKPTTKRVIYVGTDKSGIRVGESHQRASISDLEVDQMRELHEDYGIKAKDISEKMGIPLCTVKKIIRYERRTHRPERWKRVEIYD